MKTLALTFAILLLAACAAQKDFNKLSLGEQIDFSTCVFSSVGGKPLVHGQPQTAGALLDGLLGAGIKVQQNTREATLSCAHEMNINPDTIPGINN
jgi:hypothetical protein